LGKIEKKAKISSLIVHIDRGNEYHMAETTSAEGPLKLVTQVSVSLNFSFPHDKYSGRLFLDENVRQCDQKID
jgi:hypothetical protein